MKKSLLLIPLLFLGAFTFASNDTPSFPAFPMTIHGNIKIGSSNLNGGTLKVYNSSNQELASYDITQNGKYGSDNVSIEPLLLNEFNGSLTFKVFYNGKTYIVDSIDDSNKGEGCPSKSSITFKSENCRYDIVLKEESTNNPGENHSSGGGGKSSTSSTTNNKSDTTNNKSDTTKNVKPETTSTTTELDTHNSSDNEQEKINKNEGQRLVTPNTNDSSIKILNLIQGNPSQVLGNGYTIEQNNAYTFSLINGITTIKDIKDAKINGPLTRIQMSKMLAYYAINVLGKRPNTSKTPKFEDVSPELNAKYNNAVVLAYQLGIMGQNMKNNKFRPSDEVSRAEFVTALSRMLYGIEDGKGNAKYYEPHMKKLYNEGVISKADPKMKEKRGYVMTMLMRSAA